MSPAGGSVAPVKLLDIELAHPLRPLGGLAGYSALRGLVRAHGEPLGFVDISLANGGCSADTLRQAVLQQLEPDLARYLRDSGAPANLDGLRPLPLHEVLPPKPAAYAGPWPAVTVAICTRDRAHDLALCLDSLSRLDYEQLDVLIVDNAPRDDSTMRLVSTRYPHMRYVREACPGLDWARSRAVLEATCEIIAFTDDDVVVDPDWVRAIAAAFATAPADVMAVAGLVVPFELETPAQIYFERYGGFTAGFTRIELRGARDWGVRGVWHYAQMAQRFTGASMAFRRRVFDEVGLFDPALDVGTPTNGGGDIEMLFRVLKQGHAVLYDPRSIVRHRHRREYRELLHQISGWGTGSSAFLTRSALAYPAASWVLALLAVRAVWQQLRRLGASVLHAPGFPRALLWTELLGLIAGPIRYWRARRRATVLARTGDRELAEAPSR